MRVSIGPGDPDEPETALLLRRAEEHSHSLYPPEGVHTLPLNALKDHNVYFIVARDAAAILGCGAVVLQGDGFGEIKRLFVDVGARGRGVGAAILGALEAFAKANEVRCLRLETGPRQPEAIALYHRFDYRERGPFGHYREDPFSIFMEKMIVSAQTS
jgi:putative acetyltransferase